MKTFSRTKIKLFVKITVEEFEMEEVSRERREVMGIVVKMSFVFFCFVLAWIKLRNGRNIDKGVFVGVSS